MHCDAESELFVAFLVPDKFNLHLPLPPATLPFSPISNTQWGKVNFTCTYHTLPATLAPFQSSDYIFTFENTLWRKVISLHLHLTPPQEINIFTNFNLQPSWVCHIFTQSSFSLEILFVIFWLQPVCLHISAEKQLPCLHILLEIIFGCRLLACISKRSNVLVLFVSVCLHISEKQLACLLNSEKQGACWKFFL